ncbi:MAG: tetratricopeptide repeat protein, partial [Sinobacteraceae bacterium]|nr:tetratricopeptide repeat protein [Nevskiaceae bacterium]
VAFHTRRHEFYDAGYAQNYIGIAFYYEARYDEAIHAYQKALPLYEHLHEHTTQAQVLQNLALVEYDLGRISRAIPHFRRALNLFKREDNPKQYATTLANSALANWASGNQDLALHQYGESLALARKIQDTQQQRLDLHNIAAVYATLGDETRALDFFRQSLALPDTGQNARYRALTLRATANILRQQGHADEALKIDREALSLPATSSAKRRITVQVAQDLIALGRLKEAAETLDTVLNFATDEMDQARALRERGRLRALTGDQVGAESDFRAALATFKAYDLPIDEFDVWVALAQILHSRGPTPEAFAAVDQALALAEEVRLQSANPELRSTLLQPLRPAFDLKISMLSEQYLAAKDNAREREALALRALETAEQARARALADYETLDVTAPGLDPTLLERRRTLYRELAARRLRLEARLDGSGTSDSRSQAIRLEIASLRQELDQIDAKIGAASQTALARHPAAQKPTTLPLNNIPSGVAVIEYRLGSKDSFAWVVTREGVSMKQIGASPRINSEAEALHTALLSFGAVPKAERLAAGERLYTSVLGPIEGQITAVHTLIFAPDGALHYVPFATLRRVEGGKKVFLVENHDIAVIPSIQMFLQPEAPHPTSQPSKEMLLVDDPVYDPADPRVKNPSAALADTDLKVSGPALAVVRGAGSGGHLPRLPGAAREAAAIASLMPADSVDRLDGFAATRERFLTSSLGRYRLIHIASHATTDPEIPQASALILSTVNRSGQEVDGRVLAADFLGVRLHADTVVLSACDTALGKSVAGEGLIGLQYIVLARGARSVVSSLWPAIDQVTANVMVKFYSGLLRPHSTVISAWSAANRAALEGPYADPGAWGAFMLTLSHIEDVSSN